MLPFQGLAAYVPILKGICIVFGKTTQKRCVSRTLPISMMPYTMGGRLCRYLLLRCLPTGLCFGQSSWPWKIWHCSVMHVSFFKHVCNFLPIEVLIVVTILVTHQLCHIPTLPFWGDAKLYITVKGY